jgi:hypothetical protein
MTFANWDERTVFSWSEDLCRLSKVVFQEKLSLFPTESVFHSTRSVCPVRERLGERPHVDEDDDVLVVHEEADRRGLAVDARDGEGCAGAEPAEECLPDVRAVLAERPAPWQGFSQPCRIRSPRGSATTWNGTPVDDRGSVYFGRDRARPPAGRGAVLTSLT